MCLLIHSIYPFISARLCTASSSRLVRAVHTSLWPLMFGALLRSSSGLMIAGARSDYLPIGGECIALRLQLSPRWLSANATLNDFTARREPKSRLPLALKAQKASLCTILSRAHLEFGEHLPSAPGHQKFPISCRLALAQHAKRCFN